MAEKSSPELSPEQPDEEQPEPQVPDAQKPKREYVMSEADRLLSQSFAQPVRFVTYSGLKDLTKVITKTYRLTGVDANNDKLLLQKLDILFAFPKEKMPALKPHIKVRAPIKAKKLRPIKTIEKRYHVADVVLMDATDSASIVTLVTRAGYVLRGQIQSFDKYVLYMSIGEEPVVVYRHGLYEFRIED